MRLRSDFERGEALRRTTTLHDLEAERALLGGLLIDPRRLTDIEERLSPEAFYDPLHRRIYAAMLAIEDRSAIDPITVKGKLSEAGELDAATAERLRVIEESALSAANVAHYAEIILDKALRRRLAEAAEEIASLAVEAGQDVATLSDTAERLIFSVTEQTRRGEPRELQGILRETMELIQRMRDRHTAVTGLSTGIYLLDQRTTGLHPGELFILAARPGVGKTSLAMNIAVHAALRADPPVAVAIFSLEMPSTQLAMRMLCAEARISQSKLKTGRLSPHDMDQLVRHAAALWNAPIYIDDSSTLTITDLRSKARRLKQQHPDLGLIVIDYLQLMSSRGRAESRHLEIAEISRGLKSLAKELDLPIIALSQLSRDVEKGKRRPQLSDLRESGSIEQDADCVLFIHRDGDVEPQGPGGPIPVELIIAKQRNGATGSFEAVFMSEYTRFENAAREDEVPPPDM